MQVALHSKCGMCSKTCKKMFFFIGQGPCNESSISLGLIEIKGCAVCQVKNHELKLIAFWELNFFSRCHQDKKCGWLFVQAYHELCSPEQKAYLDEHYGKCKVQTPEEQKIKDIYKEIGLEKKYTDYESKSFNDILAFKHQVSETNVPWEIIEIFLKKVYKRTK